jgi:hypothetical protein
MIRTKRKRPGRTAAVAKDIGASSPVEPLPCDDARLAADDFDDAVPNEQQAGPYASCLDGVPAWDPLSESAVDARWRRAVSLAKSRGSINTGEDVWVVRTANFLRRLATCRDEADRQRLTTDMPEIGAAFQLRTGTDKLARGLVEARLLTGMNLGDVAAACGLTVGTVEMYHQVFFDVQTRLNAKNYIMCEAIGEKAWHGVEVSDVDVFLKQYGFLKGPILVDVLERFFRGQWSVPCKLDGQSKETLQELHLMLGARALVLSRVLPFKQQFRVTLLADLLEHLQALIESWPQSAQPPHQPATFLQLAAREEWAAWRKLTIAASTGRGLKRLQGVAGVA